MSELKYLLTWKIKEPFEENYRKTMKLEEMRLEKGEHFGDDIIFPIHSFVTENKAFMIVNVEDDMKLAKWAATYSPVMDWKAYPITEWSKIKHLFPK